MAPITAIWYRIVSIFDVFTGISPPGPVAGSDRSLQIPIQAPPVKPLNRDYPVWDPPEIVNPGFQCEYPDYREEDGWVACNDKDRKCWMRNTKTGERFDIKTDFEVHGPKGTIRNYTLVLDYGLLDADGSGHKIPVQLFNGSFPGPRLQACWGDELRVTVYNNLTRNMTLHRPGNGTTVHWHGFRMLNTGQYDGVNAVTQCPIPPGSSFTYKFNATQYGTSWYHSHYSLQYAAGALGAFTVYGPASEQYATQLEPIIISDWLHQSPFERWEWHMLNPKDNSFVIDNVVVDGRGHWPRIDPPNVPKTAKFHHVRFQRGVRYLMRLINGAADTTFVFSIDNHNFTVISTDFVPITPYSTSNVVVGIGQRYNIIVEAMPNPFVRDTNFWMRTTAAPGCSNFNKTMIPDEHTGIIHYTDDVGIPTTQRQNFQPTCWDETYFNDPKDQTLTPIVERVVPPKRKRFYFYMALDDGKTAAEPYYECDKARRKWQLVDGVSMWLNFSSPAILNPFEDMAKKPWLTVVDTGDTHEDDWIEFVIFSGSKDSTKKRQKPKVIPKKNGTYTPGQHPIHLHGHDFAVLDQCIGSSSGGESDCAFNLTEANPATYTLNNPPRRDVAFLPSGGYLAIAFKADNPGAWIMHCHIAVHAGKGLAATILENTKKWDTTFNRPKSNPWYDEFNDMCLAWDAWSPDDPSDPCMHKTPKKLPLQTDSGI